MIALRQANSRSRQAAVGSSIVTGGEAEAFGESHAHSLHPLGQVRAFASLRDKGQSDAEIPTAFLVTPQIVKQRLKLASVTPALLEVYAEDGMTLEQLIAITVNPDQARQVQV